MKNLFTPAIAIAILGIISSGATAATLDFVGEADFNERGVNDNTVIKMDGVNVTFSSNYFAYFDHGSAGLGVCKQVDNPGVSSADGKGNQCNTDIPNPASDDNITVKESVTIAFDSALDLEQLRFNQEGHVPFSGLALNDTLLFGINDDGLARYTFGELQAANFTNVLSATFAYDDDHFVFDDRHIGRNAEQFYLASAVVTPVPVPAALPLLLAGVAGLGAMARRRRKAV